MRLLLLLAAVALACATSPRAVERPRPVEAERPDGAYQALVAAPDRSAADRALDPGRRPAELLTFLRVLPGMRVADLGAAGGYTTELLARAVGPGGTVYGQNSKALLAFVGDEWRARLARPAMQRVIRVDRELDDPLPPDAAGLQLVVMNATYHDTIWLGTDRARMNRAVYEALAPGGAFVVIDSSASPGMSSTEAAYEYHRVHEQLVREEVQAAGFRVAGEAGFLRNPSDTRDWNAAPNEAGDRRGTSDRFVLRFVKR